MSVRQIIRILMGAIGVLAMLAALRIWMEPAMAAANLGLAAPGGLGLATLRADFAGFFGAAGFFAFAAAVRDDRRLASAPLVMIGIALTGRVITALHDGLATDQVQPMVIEAVLLVLLAAGRRLLGAGLPRPL